MRFGMLRVRLPPAHSSVSPSRGSGRNVSDYHPIYVAAYVGSWGVAPPAGQGIHREGPAPALSRISQARIALWIARHLVPTGDETYGVFDAALAEAEAFLDQKDARFKRFEPKAAIVEPATWPHQRPPDLEAVVWRAADTPRRLHAQRRLVARRARTVAYLTALRLTDEPAEGFEPMRDFIDPLDEQLLAEEFLQFAPRFREDVRKDFARLAYRGSQSTRRADLWLVELAGDAGVGLLVKLGRFWRWFEGDPREVLPHVPDEHFEAAASAVKG